MPTIDRLRERHNEFVKQLAKATAKRDKAIKTLIAAEQKVWSLIRAVVRSQKRLDKARSLAALNAGPVDRSQPLDLGSLTPEQADAEIASEPKAEWVFPTKAKAAVTLTDDDGIPAELRREQPKPPVSDVTNIPVSDFLGHGDALADRLPSDNKPVRAVPLSKLHRTKQGQANAESWNAIPAVRKAKAKPAPIPATEAKEASALNRQLSDTFFGRGMAAQKAVDQEVAAANERIARKRKARRTPDDFKAEIAGRKGSATRGRIAE